MSACQCPDACGRDHQPDDCERIAVYVQLAGQTGPTAVCVPCAETILEHGRGQRLQPWQWPDPGLPLPPRSRTVLAEMIDEQENYPSNADGAMWWHDIEASVRIALYRRGYLEAAGGTCVTHGTEHPGYVRVSEAGRKAVQP